MAVCIVALPPSSLFHPYHHCLIITSTPYHPEIDSVRSTSNALTSQLFISRVSAHRAADSIFLHFPCPLSLQIVSYLLYTIFAIRISSNGHFLTSLHHYPQRPDARSVPLFPLAVPTYFTLLTERSYCHVSRPCSIKNPRKVFLEGQAIEPTPFLFSFFACVSKSLFFGLMGACSHAPQRPSFKELPPKGRTRPDSKMESPSERL